MKYFQNIFVVAVLLFSFLSSKQILCQTPDFFKKDSAKNDSVYTKIQAKELVRENLKKQAALFKRDSLKSIILKKDSFKTTIQKGLKNKVLSISMRQFRFKDLVKFKGQASIEGYHTNFQNPRVLSQSQYMRFSARPKLLIRGLPLIADAYYTTEPNTIYNTNRLSVKFDYQEYLRLKKGKYTDQYKNLSADAGNQLGELKEGINTSTILDKEKERLSANQDRIQKSIQKKERDFVKKYGDSFTGTHRDSLRGLNNKQDSISESLVGYSNRLDSLANRSGLKQRQQDSLSLLKLYRDSSLIYNKYTEVSEKLDSINQKVKQLDSTYKATQERIQQLQQLRKGGAPEGYLEGLEEKEKKRLGLLLEKINRFEIGVTNPYYHEYGLAGIRLKGMDVGFDIDNFKPRISIGKTQINDLNSYQRNNIAFNRNIIASSVEYSKNKTKALLFGHLLFDDGSVDSRRFNNLVGLSVNHQLFKSTIIKTDIALNSHKTSSSNKISSAEGQSEIPNPKSKMAYTLGAEQKIGKNTGLEAQTKYVGPGFFNLANPFMRKNYQEHKIKVNKELFKQQIRLVGNYKTLKDDPLKLNEYSNQISGYGIKLKTRFKNRKLPNGSLSISPYQQGNNHPDSLFRINNQFSIIQGSLNYRIRKRKFQYFVMLFGSQGQSEFNDTFNAKMQSLSLNNNVIIGRSLNINFLAQYQRTFPSIDSSQSNSYQIRVSYSGIKNISLMGSVQTLDYLNGAFKRGASLNVSYSATKNLRFSLRGQYDKIDKIWGLENKNVFSGVLRLDLFW